MLRTGLDANYRKVFLMEGALLALVGLDPDPSLALSLAEALGQPVLVSRDPVAGIRTLVGRGVSRIVVLPLLLSLDQDQSSLRSLVKLASQRWPFLAFHLAEPPGWLEWADLLREESPSPAVLTARPTGDPLADSNLARLAWLVGPETGCDFSQGNLRWPEDALGPGLVELLVERHRAALQDDSLVRPVWSEVAARVALGPEDEEKALLELDRRINEMLPPAYQGRYEEVVPRSMGSASLLVEPDGRVAWDKIWTSFCDLALAGGPSHRGTLLEAVTAEEARADWARYLEVVAEIERGIRLVTALPTVESAVPGWVGVQCDSEEMAVWMLRAIVVENVMCRRQGEVLYLPAGPAFRLEKEIKNVVTVMAKTFHYWSSHRRPARA